MSSRPADGGRVATLVAATVGAAGFSLVLLVALVGGGLAARGLVAKATRSPLEVVDRYVSGLDLYVGRIAAGERMERADGVSCSAELREQNRAVRTQTDRAAREVGGARSVSLGWVSNGPGSGDEGTAWR